MTPGIKSQDRNIFEKADKACRENVEVAPTITICHEPNEKDQNQMKDKIQNWMWQSN